MKDRILENLQHSLLDVLEIISKTINGGTFFIAKVTPDEFTLLDVLHKELSCNFNKGDSLVTKESY